MTEKRLHIFYIDDEEDERLFLARAISTSALPIVLDTADSGAEALASLRMTRTLPDLLLVDIHMPGMSGFEFFELLRQAELRKVPVVMLSTSVQPKDLRRAKEMGACAYFEKPTGLEGLVQIIQ